MLTDEALRVIIADIESDLVERTVSTTDTDKFCEAICAFSNDLPNHRRPGYLLIGVDDSGIIVGANVTDQFLQKLSSIRSDGNILPIPAISVYKMTLMPENKDIAVVEVTPLDQPPVRYKGRTCIRVGPRRAIATLFEERLLVEKRDASALTFDVRPCVGATLSDLSQELFTLSYRPYAVSREVIEENGRDIKDQLASLRFYDIRRDVPTNAGILLFGSDPVRMLPGAYIQFARFTGSDLAGEPREEKVFSGDLVTVLRNLDSFVELQITSHPVHASALREATDIDYPATALRELLVNAIAHRIYESNSPVRFYWFDDRIEIQSPGGLYGEATAENFPRQNSYRNPVLAEALKTLGYVNKYGRGIYRAQAALQANGNPDAQFEFTREYVLVTIRPKSC